MLLFTLPPPTSFPRDEFKKLLSIIYSQTWSCACPLGSRAFIKWTGKSPCHSHVYIAHYSNQRLSVSFTSNIYPFNKNSLRNTSKDTLQKKKKSINHIDSAQMRSSAGETRHLLQRAELAGTVWLLQLQYVPEMTCFLRAARL